MACTAHASTFTGLAGFDSGRTCVCCGSWNCRAAGSGSARGAGGMLVRGLASCEPDVPAAAAASTGWCREGAEPTPDTSNAPIVNAGSISQDSQACWSVCSPALRHSTVHRCNSDLCQGLQMCVRVCGTPRMRLVLMQHHGAHGWQRCPADAKAVLLQCLALGIAVVAAAPIGVRASPVLPDGRDQGGKCGKRGACCRPPTPESGTIWCPLLGPDNPLAQLRTSQQSHQGPRVDPMLLAKLATAADSLQQRHHSGPQPS